MNVTPVTDGPDPLQVAGGDGVGVTRVHHLDDRVLADEVVPGRAARDGRGLFGERLRVEHVDVELLGRVEVAGDHGDVRHPHARRAGAAVQYASRNAVHSGRKRGSTCSQMPPVAGWNSSMPGVSFGWQNTVGARAARR